MVIQFDEIVKNLHRSPRKATKYAPATRPGLSGSVSDSQSDGPNDDPPASLRLAA